jgi:hypothetical protein
MGVSLMTLGSGVLALVGLLVIVAIFATQPAWIVPVMLAATAVNFALLLFAAQ